MNNLVFVGGFGAGKSQAEKCGVALANKINADDVQSFTFSQSRRDPRLVEHYLKRANTAGSHSAGALKLSEIAGLEEYFFINAPLPRTRRHILLQGGKIAVNMMRDAIEDRKLLEPSFAFVAGYTADISLHPVSNFKPLISGEISAFDSSMVLPELANANSRVHDIRTLHDEYFDPSIQEIANFEASQVDSITLIGNHNRFLVDTHVMIEEVFQAVN
jgi:hypothetical protein